MFCFSANLFSAPGTGLDAPEENCAICHDLQATITGAMVEGISSASESLPSSIPEVQEWYVEPFAIGFVHCEMQLSPLTGDNVRYEIIDLGCDGIFPQQPFADVDIFNVCRFVFDRRICDLSPEINVWDSTW